MGMEKRTRKRLTSALIVVGVIVVGTVALNFGYWMDQVRYLGGGESFTLPLTADAEYAEPNTIYIDTLGLTAPIIHVTETNEKAYQEAMTHGVGHFPGTAEIGAYGNAYIFGHSSRAPWNNSDYNTIFSLIPRLEIGDTIRATDREGRVHTYTVTRKFVVDPENVGVLDQHAFKKRILTLQTSWPLGMTLRRYVVQAEIQEQL